MARSRSASAKYAHTLSVNFTTRQRSDLQRLADKAQAPVSLVVRQAVAEKLARDLPTDREEPRRAAK